MFLRYTYSSCLGLFVGLAMSCLVQCYLHSEFLLNLVVTPMLGKFKGQAKVCNKVNT